MRPVSPSRWLLPLTLALGVAGCAHAPAAPAAAVAPRRRVLRRRVAAGSSMPLPPVRVTPWSPDRASAWLRHSRAPGLRVPRGGGRPARVDLDDDLARFTRVLGALRAARDRGRHRPPRAVLAEWDRMVGRLDDYLDQPPSDTKAADLVRTRIIVETELGHDRRAWRLPRLLIARIHARLRYLAHRLDEDHLPEIPARAPAHIEWPIDPVVVNSPFGLRTDPITGKPEFHEGVDLNGQLGQAVTAAADGVVTFTGWRGGYGNHIEIAHGGGWVTTYSHLSKILVHRGDHVEIGDLIGLVGSTGRSTGPHLHFEILHHGHVLDPFSVLGDPVFTAQSPGTGIGGRGP